MNDLAPATQEQVTVGNVSIAKIAVLVPCYNEEATVGAVVIGFLSVLPNATVYVYDNNSKDDTINRARKAGAVVRTETRQGKGNVVRRMFADIEADVYLLVDGDNTYDTTIAPEMVSRILSDQLDFVNVARIAVEKAAYRAGHRFGNIVLSNLVQTLFGRQFSDMLSGYKAFSRRFVKSFPAMSRGFEIETELAIHSLELRMACIELSSPYRERPTGSQSKLRTYRDGFRILMLIARLVKDERPLLFFGSIGLLAMMIGVAFGVPVIMEYFETGLVPRLPTALLSVGVIIVGLLSALAGLILDLSTRTRHEIKRLAYLSIPVFGERSVT